MKTYIVFFSFILILSFPYFSNAESDITTIKRYTEDITGDGLKETIELKGILLSENNNYYRKIWVDIRNVDGKEWKISYEGGYEPELQFIDVNHDNIVDLFYQSAKGGSGGLYNYNVHTLKNEQVTKISLPKQQYIKGNFEENFLVHLQLSPYQNPIKIDVKSRKDDYIRLNIYDENGQLKSKAQTSLMIDPIAFFEPVRISKSKGYGLKSNQKISGAYHADQLGTVETLWYFHEGEWIILKTDWIPSETKDS